MDHLMVQTRKDLDLKDKSKKHSLDDLTLSDLKVLLSRQTKLLSNPTIVKNLPDGGDKLRQHLSNIERTMELKERYDDAVQALGELKIEESRSPISNPTTKSRVSTSESIESDKLDRVRSRVSQRSPSTTQLLTREEAQEIASRAKPKADATRESGARLGEFLGMFKVGSAQVKCGEDDYRAGMEGEESDSCSEVSDHSKSSGGEYGLTDDMGLFEDCI